MFITFEGIDGSGKSTQASLLVDALRANGSEVLLVREPGGTLVGERIRSILLDGESDVSPIAEVMLFSAARSQLVAEVVRPALEAGTLVIADRFYDSTTAYQGGGRGQFEPGWLEDLHLKVTGGLVPDLTFLIDVPFAVSLARRSERVVDRMEAGDGLFFERVRSAYLTLAARHSDRIILLDGTESPGVIHREVLARVPGPGAPAGS